MMMIVGFFTFQLYPNYISIISQLIISQLPTDIPTIFLYTNPYFFKTHTPSKNDPAEVIYMILGIGADDVFILYDAWLQSAHVEGVKDGMNGFAEADFLGESGGYHGDI